MASDTKIRILSVDDHPMLREGIAAVLAIEQDMTLVAEAANGREAVEQYRAHRPDIVLMDLQMSNMDGVEATRAIRTEFPSIQVVVLSMSTDPKLIYDVLQAGAISFLSKSGRISDVPIALSRAIATTEIRPAIKAYSIIVTPFLSDLRSRIRRSISFSIRLFPRVPKMPQLTPSATYF